MLVTYKVEIRMEFASLCTLVLSSPAHQEFQEDINMLSSFQVNGEIPNGPRWTWSLPAVTNAILNDDCVFHIAWLDGNLR